LESKGQSSRLRQDQIIMVKNRLFKNATFQRSHAGRHSSLKVIFLSTRGNPPPPCSVAPGRSCLPGLAVVTPLSAELHITGFHAYSWQQCQFIAGQPSGHLVMLQPCCVVPNWLPSANSYSNVMKLMMLANGPHVGNSVSTCLWLTRTRACWCTFSECSVSSRLQLLCTVL